MSHRIRWNAASLTMQLLAINLKCVPGIRGSGNVLNVIGVLGYGRIVAFTAASRSEMTQGSISQKKGTSFTCTYIDTVCLPISYLI
jgi:hypothetical protein